MSIEDFLNVGSLGLAFGFLVGLAVGMLATIVNHILKFFKGF